MPPSPLSVHDRYSSPAAGSAKRRLFGDDPPAPSPGLNAGLSPMSSPAKRLTFGTSSTLKIGGQGTQTTVLSIPLPGAYTVPVSVLSWLHHQPKQDKITYFLFISFFKPPWHWISGTATKNRDLEHSHLHFFTQSIQAPYRRRSNPQTETVLVPCSDAGHGFKPLSLTCW